MQSPRPRRPGAWCSREIGTSLARDASLYSVIHAPRQARPLGPDQLGLVRSVQSPRASSSVFLRLGIEEDGS